ncbi:MFS transporter [Streptomonospora nanhaiensis]|uniref:MFS transporter n=1 Tax=Streptomonospora nanhaiensis TaxID=1323731 RepID=UPI001C995688|nr:MFS transporter [Streptomonospora nanhaiensis]MBX9391271.1 MFS transporter [Streptomonospora nanhaiensis]
MSSGSKAGVKEWVGLAVLALPILLLSLDLTALHLALPHLAADLDPTSTEQLWILDIYGFMVAGFLITMGTLGDRIGRRRMLMIGATAFGAASVAAAYAPTPETLIAARALLGISGATLMPSTLSLISNMFHDARQRGFAIAVWGSCFAAGGAIGPMAGGVLLEWFWWGAVFLMAVPVMVLLLITAPLLLPEYRDPVPGRLDLFSVVLSLAAILPFVYAFKDAAREGWQVSTFVVIAVAAVFGWLFVRRQRRLRDPLMELGLFRHRAFTVGLGSLLLGTLVQGSFILLLAQYLQLSMGLSALAAGLWMAPFAAANILGSMVSPPLAQRIGPGRTIALGLLVMACGFLMFAQAGPDSALWLPVAASMIISIGIGPLMVLVIDLVIAAAPKEKSGSASSMSETASEMGMALGVATLGAIGSAVYRSQMSDSLPAGVPESAAPQAVDSIAGATAVAQELASGTGAAVLEAARAAFTSGQAAVSYTSVAVLLVLAVLSGFFLDSRRKRGGQEGEDAPQTAGTPDAEAAERREQRQERIAAE